MGMRVFLAIPFSPELYPKITELQSVLAGLDVRWLKPSNLHITLVPPWETTTEGLPDLIDRLKEIERPKPFRLNFDSFSAGPNPRSPRLLWATGPHAPTELLKLKTDLEHAVKYRPDRGFKLHTTLARFKRDSLATHPELANISQPVHWTMLAEEFVLMESVLTAEGAEYNIVESFPFHE